MTGAAPGASPAEGDLFTMLIGLLTQVTGEDEPWSAAVTPASRLEGDLRLDSIELTALADALTSAYGDRVHLAEFVATLDIDQIISLTVSDVAAYVAGRLAPQGSPPPAKPTPPERV